MALIEEANLEYVSSVFFSWINTGTINVGCFFSFVSTVRTMVLVLQDIYAVRIQNEHCYSLKLRISKQSCEKILAMMIFDVSHMNENLWRCSIFEVDHAISFKNMITR